MPTDASDLLTLDDAIAVSLDRNPTLIAVRASEPVAHAAFHVAETYPWNPQFQTQVAPYSRDRDGNDGAVSQQHVIVQTFELGGQRRFRRGGGGQLGTVEQHDPAGRTDERGPDHAAVFCGDLPT